MTWPDEFDDLASELRRRVAADFRSEAEETERLAQLQRRRRATLRDVAAAAMHQGHMVTVRARGVEWSGDLLAVGNDYLSLMTSTSLVEARFVGIVIEVAPSRSGGRSGKPASETFRARMAEFEQTGERVTLVSYDPDAEVTGVIAVVASDHVEVINTEGATTYLPIDGVVFALRSRPQ